MSWIKNFNSYIRDYLLKEEVPAEQGIELSKGKNLSSVNQQPVKSTADPKLVKIIRDMLEQGAAYGVGTNEVKLIEAIKKITSFDVYKAVNDELRKKHTKADKYNSIETLLQGELGVDDVPTADKIKDHLKTIGIQMTYQKEGQYSTTVISSTIKLTPLPDFQPSQYDPRDKSSTPNTGGTNTGNTGGASSNTTQIKCARYRDPNKVEDRVKLLQQKLKDLGFYEGEPDGKYGDKTLEAVKKFQIKHQVSPAVGCYGPKTALKMQEVSKDYIPFKGDTKKHEKGTGTEEAGKKSQAQSTTKTQNQEQDNSIMPEIYWKETTTGETPSSNEPKQA